jgi:hypothetical protein
MPKCPTCLIDNQHTDCKRQQCNTCCTAHPYIYGACPFHDASRPPSTIPTGAQLPDQFTAAHRLPLPLPVSLPRSLPHSSAGDMDDSKNSDNGSTLGPSSSSSVPAPLTFEMIQALFVSHQTQQSQRIEQMQAEAAAERAVAETTAAATAATVEALTRSVALLGTISPTICASTSSFSCPPLWYQYPSLYRPIPTHIGQRQF